MTGRPLTVTAICFLAEVLPKLSLAFRLMVSAAWLLFFFNDTATTEFYSLSLPDALPIFVPEPVIVPPPPEADRRPLVSCSVTVKVSPVVLPVSEMLTPEIASGLPTPTVVDAGAAMTGKIGRASGRGRG